MESLSLLFAVMDEKQGTSGGKMGFGNGDHVLGDALGPLERKEKCCSY